MTTSGNARHTASSRAEDRRRVPDRSGAFAADDEHLAFVDVSEEVDHFFDPSSLPGPDGPVFALIFGAIAVGKTRHVPCCCAA